RMSRLTAAGERGQNRQSLIPSKTSDAGSGGEAPSAERHNAGEQPQRNHQDAGRLCDSPCGRRIVGEAARVTGVDREQRVYRCREPVRVERNRNIEKPGAAGRRADRRRNWGQQRPVVDRTGPAGKAKTDRNAHLDRNRTNRRRNERMSDLVRHMSSRVDKPMFEGAVDSRAERARHEKAMDEHRGQKFKLMITGNIDAAA
ncbi:MAG TPA: hypothetical protein VGF34_20115, partial [Stellaceae bacterium]